MFSGVDCSAIKAIYLEELKVKRHLYFNYDECMSFFDFNILGHTHRHKVADMLAVLMLEVLHPCCLGPTLSLIL